MSCSTASSRLHRARPRPRAADRPGLPDPRSIARSGWSIAPSTSAARRLPASRSPRARSAATGACRSPTATAAELPPPYPVRFAALRLAALCALAPRGVRQHASRTSRSRTTRWRRCCSRPTPSTGSAARSTTSRSPKPRATPAGRSPSSTATASKAASPPASRRCGSSPPRTTASFPATAPPRPHDDLMRGVSGFLAERGDAIAIPTGAVVLDIYAHTPPWLSPRPPTAVPINFPRARRSPLPARLPNSGYRLARPCPRSAQPAACRWASRLRQPRARRPATVASRSSSASRRTCGPGRR